MAYTHRHRFLKRYDLPLYVKLNCNQTSKHCGISVERLQGIYDTEYSLTHKDTLAMMSVFKFVNHEYKLSLIVK